MKLHLRLPLLLELPLAIAWGFGWHFFGRVSKTMPHGWRELCDYTVGVEATVPFFVIALQEIGFSRNAIFLAVCAYQLAFLLIGIGTALGWLLFPHEKA